MTDIALKKAPDETETQFVYRLASAREDGLLDMTWEELAEVFNRELGKNQCSSAYRKPYQNAQRYRDEVFSAQDSASVLQQLREERQELYRERTLLRDERNELNKKLREDARKRNFLSELSGALVDVPPISISPCAVETGETELVACLSDLHVGLTTDNQQNYYDENILHDRLEQYARELAAIQQRHHAGRLVLALLGDQISGSIHAALIARNSMNTVAQVKRACKEIAGFVQALTALFPKITIYSVSGNHSRINAKKEDNLPGDNLDSLIPFYLDAVFTDKERVEVCVEQNNDEYSNSFSSLGWLFVMMHGDLDAPDRVVRNATELLGSIPDVVLVGHRHNSGLMTEGRTRVVQSGCICGTDDYAYNKRLFAPPEQSVLVVSDRAPIECIYNVTFSS
jgi:predicted phosphodiesterase